MPAGEKELEEVERLLDRAEEALADGRLGDAEGPARSALDLMMEAGIDEPDLRFEACHLLAQVYVDSGFDREAEKYLQLCRELSPESPHLGLLEGRFRLLRGDFEGASERFGEVGTEGELGPWVVYNQAILKEMEGDFDAAEALYAQAASREPDRFFPPYRIDADDTDALVRQAIDSLPGEIRNAIRNYTIELAELPDPAIDKIQNLGIFVWGYFSGYAADRSNWGGSFDGYGRIRVFKRNIERCSRNLEEVKKHLRETFLHEIGHALGYDEEGLEELGL